MKNFDKNKESSYSRYWNVNNLYGWERFPVYKFKWVKDISKFDENFIKEIFLKLIFTILKNYMTFMTIIA